jgi:hypothetical protein
MTISHEQFNKIALKEDLADLESRIENKMTVNKSEILNAIDKFAKESSDAREEGVANQGAHDRIQTDVNEVRKHVGMKVKNPTL